MNKNVKTCYLILAIVAIVTAIPFVSSWIDFYGIISLGLAGLSLYIIIRLTIKNDSLRLGAILMLAACSIVLLGNISLYVSIDKFSSFVESAIYYAYLGNYYFDWTSFYSIFGIIYGLAFLFIGWVLKIVAIVFCFKNYNTLNKLS